MVKILFRPIVNSYRKNGITSCFLKRRLLLQQFRLHVHGKILRWQFCLLGPALRKELETQAHR